MNLTVKLIIGLTSIAATGTGGVFLWQKNKEISEEKVAKSPEESPDQLVQREITTDTRALTSSP